jgi:hypothetical protein
MESSKSARLNPESAGRGRMVGNDRGKAGGTDPGELARSRDARESAQEFYPVCIACPGRACFVHRVFP